jgi:hypothetical protein
MRVGSLGFVMVLEKSGPSRSHGRIHPDSSIAGEKCSLQRLGAGLSHISDSNVSGCIVCNHLHSARAVRLETIQQNLHQQVAIYWLCDISRHTLSQI